MRSTDEPALHTHGRVARERARDSNSDTQVKRRRTGGGTRVGGTHRDMFCSRLRAAGVEPGRAEELFAEVARLACEANVI